MEDLMKSLLFVSFSLLFSFAAAAQERGIIECQDKTGSVSALEEPGSLIVVKQLQCGQSVTIVGLDRGYAKIRVKENVVGYVKAGYIRTLEGASDTDRRVADLEAQVEALKQQTIPVQAQPVARIESRPAMLEIPASHRKDSSTRFDIGGLFSWIRSFEDESDYFGWNATFGGNITRHFGLEANASGNYWNSPVRFVCSSYHGLSGGPRFSFPAGRVTPFIHFHIGFARGSTSILGFSIASANFLTLMPGFGLDANINRHFAIRAVQIDYPVLRGAGDWSYKNMRIGSGIVTKF
jgi:hypothetical protein